MRGLPSGMRWEVASGGGIRRRVAGLCAVAGLAGAVAGCGPSFEAIEEGGLRFAHCDRLDLDPNVAPSHRLHCWREWRRVYTYGQTRDRVDYARRRIAVLVSGDSRLPFYLPGPLEQGGQEGCAERCDRARVSCASECSTAASGCDPCVSAFETCRARCS